MYYLNGVVLYAIWVFATTTDKPTVTQKIEKRP